MTDTNSSISFLSAKDALAILNIQSNNLTPEDIKAAYRKAAAKYHPDHNPAGLEMMKMVNVAYETLKTLDPSKTNNSTPNTYDYGDAINNALNAIINLGLTIEICSAWIWISGNTKPYKDILKNAGFFWSPKKLCWYFRPADYKSHNRSAWSMDKIREIYGSAKVKEEFKQVAYA
ncbi:Molecular chaperone DnaJ [Gammaproteobacteria bacterium]